MRSRPPAPARLRRVVSLPAPATLPYQRAGANASVRDASVRAGEAVQ